MLRALDEEKVLEHTHMFKETKESGDIKQILKFQSKAIKQIQDSIECMGSDISRKFNLELDTLKLQVHNLEMNNTLHVNDQIAQEIEVNPQIEYMDIEIDINIPCIGAAGTIPQVLNEFIVGKKNQIPLRNWCWEWSQCDKNRQKYGQRRYVAELYLKYVLEDPNNGKDIFLQKYDGMRFGQARVMCREEYVSKYGKLMKRLK